MLSIVEAVGEAEYCDGRSGAEGRRGNRSSPVEDNPYSVGLDRYKDCGCLSARLWDDDVGILVVGGRLLALRACGDDEDVALFSFGSSLSAWSVSDSTWSRMAADNGGRCSCVWLETSSVHLFMFSKSRMAGGAGENAGD